MCISPDGTELIFGYAVAASSMAGMYDNGDRYLVRIISYDMINRTSSIIREWSGSNLSDSINADYVDFCIDALEVDWNNEKIYFSEEILRNEGDLNRSTTSSWSLAILTVKI